MDSVLVTGASGFIGSHLCDFLIENEFQVLGIDNLSNGRITNLEKSFKSSKFTFLELDIQNSLHEIPSEMSFGAIFHLAALADIVPSITNPKKYFDSNVQGTLSVMEYAKDKKIPKVIYTASSSCYGIPESYPTREDNPISNQYPYALTKYLGEQIVLHWGNVYGIDVTSLRLFNVYGPRARTSGTYGAVFGVFLAQKLAGKPLTIVGDGEQTRDFTYVTDVVRALVKANQHNLPNKIYNVGSGNTHSINYLVKLIGGEKLHIPKRPGEPDCTFADISRIKNDLRWNPEISFEDGVKTMLANIDDWANAPVWNRDSIEEATADWFKFLGSRK